jgi:hypothetical protein
MSKVIFNLVKKKHDGVRTATASGQSCKIIYQEEVSHQCPLSHNISFTSIRHILTEIQLTLRTITHIEYLCLGKLKVGELEGNLLPSEILVFNIIPLVITYRTVFQLH